jgi:hypothetical protein
MHGLEGIVSKLSFSRYRSGCSRSWLKVKCFTETPFVIIGTDGDRSDEGLYWLGLRRTGSPTLALPSLLLRLRKGTCFGPASKLWPSATLRSPISVQGKSRLWPTGSG